MNTANSDTLEATDYASGERLIEEASRRHDILSAISKWRNEFRIFKKIQGRIGVDEENEAEKNSYLAVVRKIKEDGHRMLEAIDTHRIDTERECGIRLAALKACVEQIEDDERFLFLAPEIVEKLNLHFGVK